ncbi:MAG TPA: metalloregulator ArsR/SmtB family transcription factor [Candidatus Cybelea sp.]
MAAPRCNPIAEIDRRDFAPQAAFLKALADPYRLTIVATLAGSPHPVCVCDFTDGLGLRQSSVSHHLAILRDAGIVRSERRGTWAYYALVPGLRERVVAMFREIEPPRKRLAGAS